MKDKKSFDMITHLKEIYAKNERELRYEVFQALNSCMIVKGASVSAHLLKMKSYIEQLEELESGFIKEKQRT